MTHHILDAIDNYVREHGRLPRVVDLPAIRYVRQHGQQMRPSDVLGMAYLRALERSEQE